MYRVTISALLILLLASTAALAASVTENPGQLQEVRAPEAAGSAEHDCCPPMAHFRLELVQPESSSEMPCGGHHSCCMSSAPDYSANVPTTLTWERQGTPHDSVVVQAALPGRNSRTFRGTPGVHLLLYSRFSTVLRI